MNEEVFNAVIARNAARVMRLPDAPTQTSSLASTTGTLPLDPAAPHGAIYAAESAMRAARLSVSNWNATITFDFQPGLLWISTMDTGVQNQIYSRVQQYVERSIQAAGLYYGGDETSYRCSADRFLIMGDWGKASVDAVSVFAAEVIDRLIESECSNAPAAFNCVELVEERDARAQRLFAELQNAAPHGPAMARRLRDLEEVANEEGEPFSLDALEALVMFLNGYPGTPMPELTLSGRGAIVAEWRRRSFSVTLYFVTPINVQYLVKRSNPLHRELVERSSGTTTVDRLGDTLKNLLSVSEWPIRA